MRTLGLKNITVLSVARAGLIRYVRGSEHYFPTGFHFLCEDVLKIKHAFKRHAVPMLRRYSRPGELIAPRHALKNYLGRDFGLPAVIRAVLDRRLAPVAVTNQFRGITGYLFRSEDLRAYRPVPDTIATPGGFLNYREAASMLGTGTEVVRGLVAHQVLSSPTKFRNGFAKLIPVAEVRAFEEQYVPVKIVAKRYSLDVASLRRRLETSGTPVLSIPVPEKGRAISIDKNVAAHLNFESR
jgi:hypothetical protein